MHQVYTLPSGVLMFAPSVLHVIFVLSLCSQCIPYQSVYNLCTHAGGSLVTTTQLLSVSLLSKDVEGLVSLLGAGIINWADILWADILCANTE